MAATQTTVKPQKTTFSVTDLKTIELAEHEQVALELGKQLKVSDASTYKQAVETLGVCKKVIKRIDAFYKAQLKPMDAVYDLANALKKDDRDPWCEVLDDLDQQSRDWLIAEKERERQAAFEAQQKADAEALQRREQQAAAMSSVAAMEEDPMVAAALHEEAQAIKDAPPIPAKVQMQSSIPKVAGVHTRQKFVGDVESVIELLKDVIDGNVPSIIVKIDQAKLNAYITDNGGAKAIRGVKIREDVGFVNR